VAEHLLHISHCTASLANRKSREGSSEDLEIELHEAELLTDSVENASFKILIVEETALAVQTRH
jgi:hypothetical protein